jgi:uncharacterized protein YegP (UPF0339 family)
LADRHQRRAVRLFGAQIGAALQLRIKDSTMKYELYQSGGGWRWRLRAANGEIVASGEAYRNKDDCVHAVNLLMDTTRQTKFVEVSS